MANDLLQGAYVETVDVTRGAADTYVNGRRVPGATTALTVQACVRPLKPTELAVLNLGERVTTGLLLYSVAELKTASEAASTPADVVTWQGVDYEVHSAARRTQIPGLDHWHVTALRVEGQ